MADFRFGDYEISAPPRNFTTALGFLAIGLGLGCDGRSAVHSQEPASSFARICGASMKTLAKPWKTWASAPAISWERGEEWAEAARRKAEPVTRAFRNSEETGWSTACRTSESSSRGGS